MALALPSWVCKSLLWLLRPKRDPDEAIGGSLDPYMLRWHILPRNRWFNIYFHEFYRSDDDRALHDHPWWSVSLILQDCYGEVLGDAEGMPSTLHLRSTGSVTFRKATQSHRIIVPSEMVPVSLFFTGPRVREWGFWCPQGWRPWTEYSKPGAPGEVGKGCD